MRVALAVVGGLATLAALAGAFKGLVIVLGTILLGASEDPEWRHLRTPRSTAPT